MHEVRDLDRMARHIICHTRSILGYGPSNTSVWFRMALATGSGCAVIFDDPDQFNPAGPPLIPPLFKQGSQEGKDEDETSSKLDKGRPPLARILVTLKSSILKLCITNRQQVMIPDVPTFLAQSGRATSDLYINTEESLSFIRPTSVLVFPLKVGGVMTGGSMALGLGLGGTEGPANGVKNGSYGALFCMSGTLTDFADITPRLKEICDVLSPHILQVLTSFGPICNEYQMSVVHANADKMGSARSSSKDLTGFGSVQGRRMSQQRSSTAVNLLMEARGSKDGKIEPIMIATASASIRSVSGKEDKAVSFFPTSALMEGLSSSKSAGGKRLSSSYLANESATGLAMERVDLIGDPMLEEEEVAGERSEEDGEELEEEFDFFSPQERMLESLLPPSDRAARLVEKLAMKKVIRQEDLLALASDLRSMSRGRGSNNGTQGLLAPAVPSLFGSLRGSSNMAQMIRGFNKPSPGAVSSTFRTQSDMSHMLEKASLGYVRKSIEVGGHEGPQFSAMPQDVTKALISLLAVDEEEDDDEEEWNEEDGNGSPAPSGGSPSSNHGGMSGQRNHKSTPHELPAHAERLLKVLIKAYLQTPLSPPLTLFTFPTLLFPPRLPLTSWPRFFQRWTSGDLTALS